MCGFESIVIPKSVTSIGDLAFALCQNLSTIIIPQGVTNIGKRPYLNCPSLAKIIVEDGNAYYDSRDNCNAIIEKATNKLITGSANTIIPESVTAIDYYAFHGNKGLTGIKIPNSVIYIGESAFGECTNLVTVKLPEYLTAINNALFFECRCLKTITIPTHVNLIDELAFWGCYGIQSISLLNANPPEILSNTFSTYTATLYVPVGSKTAYQNAEYWKNFTNIIEGDPSGIEKVKKDAVNENAPLYNLNGYRLKEPQRGINIVGGKKVIVR